MTERQIVHVVDDEDSMRRSLDFLLRNAGYAVERWPDGETFLKGVSREARGCVLLDIRMVGIDGLEVQARMAREGLDFPVIMLTGHGDVPLSVRAMKAGAVDFLEKPCDREKLLQAIRTGFGYLHDRETRAEQQLLAKTRIAGLTERERQVLDGLACGYPNKTIAFDLGISVRTVEVYRANLMSKLDLTNFADTLRIAFAAGLGSDDAWQRTYRIATKRGLAPVRAAASGVFHER
ncbi:two-component system response regulator FixJ [Novosphingobium sp. SG751A]|uniref:response regulator transcription factor n=1 Tax=Novosphingobium sp. SG751A TaxID=2587000 RepID=UPI0015538456|nr:response regulator [Novosphingobium sp. SG751A]NOW48262.1 two-component system response regulator FixJ [Novosphingobium sp. SG751A]